MASPGVPLLRLEDTRGFHLRGPRRRVAHRRDSKRRQRPDRPRNRNQPGHGHGGGGQPGRGCGCARVSRRNRVAGCTRSSIRRVRQGPISRSAAAPRIDPSSIGDRPPRTTHLGIRRRPGRGDRASRQRQRVRGPGRPDRIGNGDSFAAGRRHRRTPRQRGRPVDGSHLRRRRPDGRGIHPLQAHTALHPGLDGAWRPGGGGAAARRGAADHRADGRRLRRDAGSDTGGCRTAGHAPDRAAALGSARRGIRLLDVESRPLDGRRPLQGGRATGSQRSFDSTRNWPRMRTASHQASSGPS